MNTRSHSLLTTPPTRRQFLSRAALAAAFFTVPGAFAEELVQTPAQTEGPFYPDHLPLDTDNDLIVINDAVTPAVGMITYLGGRVLGPTGEPVRGATVEIWQCDANGAYLHSRTGNANRRDGNFQGFGRFLTASTGEYLFRTIKPVAYPGRAPHIHVMVKAKEKPVLTTQFYVQGDPGNDRDGLRRRVSDPRALQAITGEFTPLPGGKAGELAARFDIVLGRTPEMA